MSDGFSIIGKPTAMIDAAQKTTGAGKYTDDLSVPGMLTGKILHFAVSARAPQAYRHEPRREMRRRSCSSCG